MTPYGLSICSRTHLVHFPTFCDFCLRVGDVKLHVRLREPCRWLNADVSTRSPCISVRFLCKALKLSNNVVMSLPWPCSLRWAQREKCQVRSTMGVRSQSYLISLNCGRSFPFHCTNSVISFRRVKRICCVSCWLSPPVKYKTSPNSTADCSKMFSTGGDSDLWP